MWLLVLKVSLAPLLVLAASLAQRRWGAAVGGRLVGLPLTATPLLILVDLARGPHFTAQVATSGQAGDVAATGWCVAYALVSRRVGIRSSLLAAFATWAVIAVALSRLPLGLATATILASVALIAALVRWPRPAAAVAARTAHGDDLVVRMLIAAAFTLAVSESAGLLGAGWDGLVSSLPLITIVLTTGTHLRQGPGAANRFLHGVEAGSFSVVAFLAVVAIGLDRIGSLPTFALALVAALVVQVLSGRVLAALPTPTAQPTAPRPRSDGQTSTDPTGEMRVVAA